MPTPIPAGRSDSKEQAVEAYLREQVTAGKSYFKSRFIADDLNLSASEIGAIIAKLEQDSGVLEIERWSYTNGTTWQVGLSE